MIAAVAGQEDLDRARRGRPGTPAERPGERVDDVAEPARLGPGLALGGDEDDAHRHAWMVPRHGRSGHGGVATRRRRGGHATKPVHARGVRRGIIAGSWNPSSASPSCPAHRSACRPSSRACAASPTTCGGCGTRGAALLFAADRRGPPGPATATRSPLLAGPDQLAAAARRPGLHGRVRGRSWPSSTRYMANGADHWFQRAPRRAARRARSPTSAPSTASTSRWASTPAASASSPATT